MTLGLVGKKIGMTRLFTEQGKACVVTVVEATPNRITQIKTVPIDGYDAIQVTVGERRASRVNKAMKGHFAKAEVEPGRGVWEFRLRQPLENIQSENIAEPNESDKPTELKMGTELTVEMFRQGEKVDVTGQTIGKGFAGVMKRYGFRGGRATHGNSKAHRLGGSIGNAQDPGRVFKGKKMAGHMGTVQRVQQGLEVLQVDRARNLLLLSGSIPGSKGSDVIVRVSARAGAAKQGMQAKDPSNSGQ